VPQRLGKRTLLISGELLTATTTGTRCRGRGVLYRCLGASIALASARSRLVGDLGGRLGFPVRVELWVVACDVSVRGKSLFSMRYLRGWDYPGARRGSAEEDELAIDHLSSM